MRGKDEQQLDVSATSAPSSAFRRITPCALKSIEAGAATAIWCATNTELNDKGGVYCEDCDIARVVSADDKGCSGVRPYATDKAAAKALWTLSEKLTNVQFKI